MRLEDKGKQIIKDIKSETGTSPIRIFKNMAHKDYIATKTREWKSILMKA